MTYQDIWFEGHCLGRVEISDNPDPAGCREERVLFGREALQQCLRQAFLIDLPIDTGAVYLGILASISRGLNNGERDEPLEADISRAYMHYVGALKRESVS